MKQIVVSFSGGRTSAYLCSLIKKMHTDAVFVFMDTGAEHPATYDFVRQCNNYFGLNLVCLRAKVSQEQGIGVGYEIIDIADIGHNLNVWRDMLEKYSTPYVHGAFCTKNFKTTPFEKYANNLWGRGNYHTILGIRVDEPKRLKPRNGFSYLADISDFEKQDVLDWWAKMPFNLQIPEHLGNCVFCIKKGVNKIALAAKDEPKLASEFMKVVEGKEVKLIPSRTISPEFMYRNNMSLRSIIELYEEMPRDQLAKTVRSTFETGSCSESCEAFAEQMDLAL